MLARRRTPGLQGSDALGVGRDLALEPGVQLAAVFVLADEGLQGGASVIIAASSL